MCTLHVSALQVCGNITMPDGHGILYTCVQHFNYGPDPEDDYRRAVEGFRAMQVSIYVLPSEPAASCVCALHAAHALS